jgi:hypothetical protein
MSSQASALGLQSSVATLHHRRVARTASENPCDDDHQDPAGALTFGTVYAVDRSVPLPTRVWRTTVNWLDANRVGSGLRVSFRSSRADFSGHAAASPHHIAIF